jgi:DNA-directed RNA polymerase specialized sigma24 family protein
MPLTEEILTDARALKAGALEALLASGYAPARRIALALSGSDSVARAVAEHLARRSLRMVPRWQDPSSAENWFCHHAVLATRSVGAPAPEPQSDPLVLHAPSPADPAYVAFVRALRLLPVQQREAFILHHGERLNPRMLGVAMDCSTGAAATHLDAATLALRTVGGELADAMTEALARAYAALKAAQPDLRPAARVHIRRARRRFWARRIVRVAVLTLVLGALFAVGFILWDIVRRMLPWELG